MGHSCQVLYQCFCHGEGFYLALIAASMCSITEQVALAAARSEQGYRSRSLPLLPGLSRSLAGRLRRGWSIAALCRAWRMLPASKILAWLCRSSPWSVNNSLPLTAAAGKCNLGFSFQALGCLKLIMSFKEREGKQGRNSETKDLEGRVLGSAL